MGDNKNKQEKIGQGEANLGGTEQKTGWNGKKEDILRLQKEADSTGEAFERLLELIRYLRSPEGCPWDQVQTHESLKKCLIEETYEVIDAIDKNDADLLEEELGDLALQVVFHALLAEEKGLFNAKNILNRVSDKMVYRHPHVFLRENAENRDETLDNALIKWENMKKREKSRRTYTEAMNDLPEMLPALMKSCKVQEKAAQVGFDWDNVQGALDKVSEEVRELEEAHRSGSQECVKEELGDLLFSVVNAARFLDVEPEGALQEATRKFIRRFQLMEDRVIADGKEFSDLSFEQMDQLWEDAKKISRNRK